MDLQDIIHKLNRHWAKQGCALMPLGAPPAHRFAGSRAAGPLALAGAVRLPPAGAPHGRADDGLGGAYRYQVFFRSPPADIRRAFLDSLKTAGIDRSEHDVRWLAVSRDYPAAGAAGCGWDILLDGAPLARLTYLRLPAGSAAGPAGFELVLGLERLALASQRKRRVSELAWAGRLTYGELHPGETPEAA